jgi:streptomycin 3"-adenylyltransferase
LRETLGARLLGVYLYGSAVAGGLRPASDLDLFALTSRRTSAAQRKRLIVGLRPLSARGARPADWRPVELSVVARPDIVPWRYPPVMDFISGEWLRSKFDAGEPTPTGWVNPDLAVLVAQVRQSGRALIGHPPAKALPEVPVDDVTRGMVDEIASLRSDLKTDTANVLLTLARIWYTLATGAFVPKNTAADWVIPQLTGDDPAVLERARDAYLGLLSGTWLEQDAWQDLLPAAKRLFDRMVGQIDRLASVATIPAR